MLAVLQLSQDHLPHGARVGEVSLHHARVGGFPDSPVGVHPGRQPVYLDELAHLLTR